ncbi:MAG: hypothetical protein IPO33_08360 [Saprospiraceae bacterium]|nr:hypothetical protein [Candidatus Brachybacter algidus]
MAFIIQHSQSKICNIAHVYKTGRAFRIELTSSPNMIEKSIGTNFPESTTKD